jgi:hypothetical protein
MSKQQSHDHHYVPQWYQRRFMKTGQLTYNYLDLHPDKIKIGNGKEKFRRDLLPWAPPRCFYVKDLYTLKLGGWSSDEIEKRFFGAIDDKGRNAVRIFGDYEGYCDELHGAHTILMSYMDAQRFRTPKGLDYLAHLTGNGNANQRLLEMQAVCGFHVTMWMEGVWEVVRARKSPTKFIVSDEPVTFYNRKVFPGEIKYPHDARLLSVGTRTIFPLGLEACLIITHLQLTRDPEAKPTVSRTNARAYMQTLRHMMDVQFGRELEEDEIIRINHILKRRATRYIAAAEKEWLYPERFISSSDWSKLDEDWFLLPNLYKIPFSGGITVGYKDGSVMAMDEYGRHPWQRDYADKEQHQREFQTCEEAKLEWIRKRANKSAARVDDSMGENRIGDARMARDLAEMNEAVSVSSSSPPPNPGTRP